MIRAQSVDTQSLLPPSEGVFVYRITYTNAKSSFETLRSFTADGYGSYFDNHFLICS
jgi:hypothetical protein